MNKLSQVVDLDALRSFVTGIECGSFALAATRLCRSTSAVSAQLKKLESQCGVKLVTRNGRNLALTRNGEILMGYAYRLLSLNDELQHTLNIESIHGEVRIGMQDDFGAFWIPKILADFKKNYSKVKIFSHVDRNQPLIDKFNDNSLDMVLLWHSEPVPNDVYTIGYSQMEWIYHPKMDVENILAKGEPLPLVMFEQPCLMRTNAISSLNRAGIPWCEVFSSHSLSGVWAAVQAGLGVTVRTNIGLPKDLRMAGDILPRLGRLGIILRSSYESEISQSPISVLGGFMKQSLSNMIIGAKS